MAELFTVAVAILILGFLWFWVIRPIAIDFGLWPLSRVSVDMRPVDEKLPEWLARDREAGIKPSLPVSVLVSSSDTAGFDLDTVPSDLTYEEVVTILAGQMTATGKPLYSGKKIYGLVGGNYNEFSALMRELRSKDDAPAEPPTGMTPIAKRPTRATFQENDPDLARQPLP